MGRRTFTTTKSAVALLFFLYQLVSDISGAALFPFPMSHVDCYEAFKCVFTVTNSCENVPSRPVLAPGEGEGGETPAEDSTGPPARPAEEPQRGWYTYKGTVRCRTLHTPYP